jgi:hypothetical protein
MPPAPRLRVLLPRPQVPGPRALLPVDDQDRQYYVFPSTDTVEEYIERGLLRLNKKVDDEAAVQKIVFHLITRAHLTTDVFNKLCGLYLRKFGV